VLLSNAIWRIFTNQGRVCGALYRLFSNLSYVFFIILKLIEQNELLIDHYCVFDYAAYQHQLPAWQCSLQSVSGAAAACMDKSPYIQCVSKKPDRYD